MQEQYQCYACKGFHASPIWQLSICSFRHYNGWEVVERLPESTAYFCSVDCAGIGVRQLLGGGPWTKEQVVG